MEGDRERKEGRRDKMVGGESGWRLGRQSHWHSIPSTNSLHGVIHAGPNDSHRPGPVGVEPPMLDLIPLNGIRLEGTKSKKVEMN